MKLNLLKLRTFLKKIFLILNTKEWISHLTTKLRTFVAFSKNSIFKLFKNPLETIPKIVSILVFLGIAGLLAYNIFSEQVFIEDVEIQGEAKEKGFTGEMITEQAIALIPSIIIKRLDNIPTNTSFLQPIERHSDNYQTEKVCNFSIFLFPPDYAPFLTGVDRVEMSSKTPDQVITSQSISIKKLAHWIRKKFRLGDVRQLKPILWKDNNKFVLKINPTPSDVPIAEYTFETLDDAPKFLASMLIDYISPEILAAELLGNGLTESKNYNFSAVVANRFLDDKQKELRIINAYVASQLDFSRVQSDIKFKYKLYEKINEELLNELDFQEFGEYGLILKTLFANSLMKAKCYNECSIKNVEEYIGKYRGKLKNSPYGLLTLLFIEINQSDLSYFYNTLDQLLKKDLRQETKGLFSNLEIALIASNFFVSKKEYQNALKILETPLPNSFNFNLEPKPTVLAYHSMKAGLKTLQGDLNAYEQLKSEKFLNSPCARWMMTSSLSYAIGEHIELNLTDSQLVDLGMYLSANYLKLEQDGFKSHSFYNQWGILEKNIKHFDSAYEKYKQALQYEGDQAWVLLNWGSAALAKGDLNLALEKYQQSLQLGEIPAAAHGLLSTLWRQGDKKAYIENFEKYSENFFVFSHPVRSEFERVAILFSCELGNKLTNTLLYPNEGILDGG